MKKRIILKKRTEEERQAYIEGYVAGRNRMKLNYNAIEEITQSLIYSNKDIDTYTMTKLWRG